MARLTVPARGAVIALALALLWAAPAAAAKPVRIVIDGGPSTRLLPAGTYCDFDVTAERPLGTRLTIWDFSDGREALMGSVVRRTITNVATGASFVAPTSGHEVDWFDPNSTVVRGVVNGAFLYEFLPGDVGPDGAIVDHLLEVFIQGHVTYAYDANTSATLEFSVVGTVTDICAAIS